MKKIALAAGPALLLILVTGFFAIKVINTPYRGYGEEGVTVEVRQGMGIGEIVDLLEKRGVVRSAFFYKVYLRIRRPGVMFKAGEYRFDRPMNYRQITEKLVRGKVVLYKITVPEGLTIRQTAETVAAQRPVDPEAFVEMCKDPALIRDLDPKAEDLEGYLYPDTYLVPGGISTGEMVKLMVERFRRKITPVMIWQATEMGFSLREIVTLASLIEKETARREERFLISSVFHNRLRIGMPLACDPTIIYALMKAGTYDGKLGWDDLKVDSPYNTRIYRGLPPGPICSPGLASIEGALYPRKTRYLYFVAKGDGSHYFSKTLGEHNRAVRKYIINR